jgi:hypothetical protein
MNTVPHETVEARLDAQQKQLDALMAERSAQGAQPAYMARIGGVLLAFALLILALQNNVWYALAALRGDMEDHKGHYSKRYAFVRVAMQAGGAMNAIAVACYVHFALGRTDLLPWGCGYIAFFAANAAVAAAKGRALLRAGTAWMAADDTFRAKLFRAFGVEVDKLTDDKVSIPLYLLVALVPAIVSGFVAHWFSVAKYETDCSAQWTAAMDGVSHCIAADSVCCKMLDKRFDYFTFTAFLTGNVIAAYKIVQYGALCLLAKAKADGAVEGGKQGGRKWSLAQRPVRGSSGASIGKKLLKVCTVAQDRSRSSAQDGILTAQEQKDSSAV